MKIDIQEDIHINASALDVEWLKQPMLFLAVAEEAAYAREKLDRAKESLDVARAELAGDIRSDPEPYGLSKVTEGSLNEAIAKCFNSTSGRAIEKNYVAANETYIKAKTEHELTIAAVRAFDQRKVALENLVRLQGQSYFAGPKEPRDLVKEESIYEKARESRSEAAAKKVAERMAGTPRRRRS